MERMINAVKYFEEGYACSQAVALAFSDLVELDEDTIKKIALPFGGGFGRLREVCGAVSGMGMIVGIIFAKTDVDNKLEVYNIVQELANRFKARRCSINCGELLKKASVDPTPGGAPDKRTPEYYIKRPCSRVVWDATEILKEYLIEQNIIKNS